MASSGKMEGPSAPALRRDPYEVLSVSRDSSDQEIKSAYRKLALKFVLTPPTVSHSTVPALSIRLGRRTIRHLSGTYCSASLVISEVAWFLCRNVITMVQT
jgi:hypothetical protein